MIILNAVQGVFTVFFMIAIGYALTSRHWFDEKTQDVFSKLVTNVSLPCFMIANLTTNYDRSKLLQVLNGSFIPTLSMIICFILALVLSNILKIDRSKKGVFRVAFALSNTIFIGLPVNVSLFGEVSVPFVMLYYISNTIFFWTIGVYEIRKDSSNSGTLFSKENLKKILNPPIISFFITIILIMFNFKLPSFLLDGFKYIGNLTTPLSTLFIGMVLYSLKLEDLSFDKGTIIILLGRFIVAPIVMGLLIFNFDLPILMKKVFIIQAAMPVMTQTAIVARSFNGDYKYATVLGTISTAASLLFIPLYMIIFSYF